MDRLEKIALRIKLAESEGLERYEIILKCDREQKAFDSEVLYRSVLALPEAVQMKVQLGSQFVNQALGFKPVLVGTYGRIHYSKVVRPLPFEATYLVSGLNKFISQVIEPVIRAKGIEIVYSSDQRSIAIPQYGCRVIDGECEFERFTNVNLARVFGYNLLVADWHAC